MSDELTQMVLIVVVLGVALAGLKAWTRRSSDGGSGALTPVDNLTGTNLQGLGLFINGDPYGPGYGDPYAPGYGDPYVFTSVILGYDDQSIYDDDNHDDMMVLVEFTPIPVPPALLLFGSGILGMIGFARRKKS